MMTKFTSTRIAATRSKKRGMVTLIPVRKKNNILVRTFSSSGANPAIVSYNASAEKIYTSSLVRFENKNILFCPKTP
jgi:hypothetical protein